MYLTVDGITKKYSSITAIENISFKVNKGAFTTLLGPSGCGKTTTLRCIAGLEIPDEGEITMDGQKLFSVKDNVNLPPHERGIGMVFQSYAIWPHMNVFENVAFPLRVRKIPFNEITDRVRKILDLVDLPGLENRSAAHLSGGQQQRVALSRSLVMEPKLLLLDEPLSNLDAKLREDMRIELKELQKRLKITTLYVTHDQAEAFSLSDDMKIIIDGKIMTEGPPQKLFCSPGKEQIAEFLGCTNKLPVKIKGHVQDNENLAHLETPIGEIYCYIPKTIKEDSAFSIYIRPSNITIYRTKPDKAVNVLKGKIEHMTYLGSDHIEYHVNINDQFLRVKGKLLSNVEFTKELFFVIDPKDNICV